MKCVDGICCASDCSGTCSTCATGGTSWVAAAEDAKCASSSPESTTCVTYPADPVNACADNGACADMEGACPAENAPRGTGCGVGQECDGDGTCASICARVETFCDGACINPSSDERHCGGVCNFSSSCSEGFCSKVSQLL